MFRGPVVVILGHVDHGKTTLLDYLRKSQLAKREFGGITQKIGAYQVTVPIKTFKSNKITFIDTPGHEAFSKLRSRGATVADLAILVVDAKDSVMPQTIESIYHIKNAKIPLIVAVNKIDLPEANSEKVKNDLLKHDLIVEDRGGNVPLCLISAKTGKGIPELLETIILMSEFMNLTWNDQEPSKAYIIETKQDRRGIVASAIIKEGKIRRGDFVYIEQKKIKVRSLFDETGQLVDEVSPSMPFEILGFDNLPPVGALISSIKHESSSSKPLISRINQKPKTSFSLEKILGESKEEKKLSLIIRADSQGSLEAIENSMENIKNLEIVLKGIGEINKSDVFLAKTTNSVIIGFEVKVAKDAEDLAHQEKIIIKTYRIIYELIEELSEVANLIKEKEIKERNIKGEAKVLATFIVNKEKIFGVKITKGKIALNDSIEVYRNNKLIGKTKLISLKHKAKFITEAKKDMEAGMIFYPNLDISVGDVIKSIL
ncbi:MAG: translation initiation factor IF-2 [Patescibacteria group bacterium]|nr:translation initiation factor IF-2 [Patescibacteria group bacterium]